MGSVFNHEECEAIVKEIKRLLLAGYTGSIGVVTPFAYQADRIRRELEKDRKLYAKLHSHHDFQSNTAHGFQGDERDLMIFSVVATESLSQGALRFLEHEGNVFNVAITRARAELVVVGDLSYCLQTPIGHLKAFAQYTQEIKDRPELPPRPAIPGREYQEDPLRGPRPWEKKLYEAMFDRGIQSLPGYTLEQYVLDLAIVDKGQMIAIDIDDEDYHREWTGETCEREQLRAQRLLELGWKVHRIWVYQIKADLEWCVEEIAKTSCRN
jgi:very-short-patch-repair endonuclease